MNAISLHSNVLPSRSHCLKKKISEQPFLLAYLLAYLLTRSPSALLIKVAKGLKSCGMHPLPCCLKPANHKFNSDSFTKTATNCTSAIFDKSSGGIIRSEEKAILIELDFMLLWGKYSKDI